MQIDQRLTDQRLPAHSLDPRPFNAPLLMQFVCTDSSMPHCSADPWMSCSFFTVSLPMCSSLLTWSSTLGISTLPAVRVRRVATSKGQKAGFRLCCRCARSRNQRLGLMERNRIDVSMITCKNMQARNARSVYEDGWPTRRVAVSELCIE